jgi:molybdopterin synthase catalytic subunit
MTLPRLAVLSEPLSAERLAITLERELRDTAHGCGAVATFLGVVRGTHQGRKVRLLEYEAYVPLAENVLALIEREVAEFWPSVRLALHHRIGRLVVGEASVAIAAASAHRTDAFQACRYAIERVKQVAPIWKREFFDDGAEWIEGAVADPSDRAARDRARTIACA